MPRKTGSIIVEQTVSSQTAKTGDTALTRMSRFERPRPMNRRITSASLCCRLIHQSEKIKQKENN